MAALPLRHWMASATLNSTLWYTVQHQEHRLAISPRLPMPLNPSINSQALNDFYYSNES